MKKTVGICLALLAVTACTSKLGYVDKGNAFFRQGKYADAEINYRKALQKDRNYGEAYYRLGLTALQQAHGAEAYNAFLRAQQLLPDNIEVKEKLAELSLGYYLRDPKRPERLYQQTQQLAAELLAQDPNSFEGLRLKGLLAREDRKPQDAISYFQKALQVRPWDPRVTTALVQVLLETGRYPEAEKTALELVGREKTFGPAYDVLYNFYSRANRAADAENIIKLKVANNPKRADYIVQLAGHYARVRKPADVKRTLQRLIDDPQDFPDGQLRAGDFYLAEKDYPQAIASYQAAERSNPKDKLGFEKKALVAMLAASRFDDASRLVDQILKESPDDNLALRMRADLLINSGKPENAAPALQILQSLQKSHPNDTDPGLRLTLGRAYLLKGDLETARAELKEALREQKDFPAAQYELGRLDLLRRKPEEALEAANAAVAMAPSNHRARLLQAWSLAANGDEDKARVILDQLLKESPKDADARLQLGLLSLRDRNYQEAANILENLRQGGNPSAITSLADAYVGLRQFDKALATLGDGLKQSPGSIPIREQLARTTALAGDYDLAVKRFQQLIDQDPKSSPLRMRLGEVYQAKGDLKNALVFYKQAHDLAPNELTPALVLADALAKADRNDEAKVLYRQIVQSHPDNPPALNNAAFFLSDHGDLEEAQRLAEKALEKVPGQPGFYDTLGYVYLKRGQREAAIRAFSDLVRRYPTLSIFHYHLALALYEKGDRSAAKKELQKALADHPGSAIEPRIKQLLSSLS